MVNAYTTTTVLDNSLPTYLAETRLTLQGGNIVWNLIDKEKLPNNQGLSVNIPKNGTVTASRLTEGVAISSAQAITDTTLSISPAEDGVMIVLTERALRRTTSGLMARSGKITANAMNRLMETNLLTLFSGASGGLGSAGTVMTIGHIQAAHVQVMRGSTGTNPEPGAMAGPIVGVFHPFQLNSTMADLSGQASGAMVYPTPEGPSAQVVRNHFVTHLSGIDLFSSYHIDVDASDDAIGAVFAKEAFIGVMGLEMETKKEYDIQLRGWKIVVRREYGSGEYNDAWVRSMTFDAAAPTS